MRLLNTTTLELSEFQGNTVPDYAVLSHTWHDNEEVSFYEFVNLPKSVQTRSGFRKIQGACKVARDDGIHWIWIDTICIDKSSSAELTESINSMFNWYKRSNICYAYLSDVPDLQVENYEEQQQWGHFRDSRWLRRGWTLQELIAPTRMVFYSQSWARIGDRSGSLAQVISEITGIEVDVFNREKSLAEISIAKKMSWAARRVTTRVEDIAYCLLGIFDVNIPLLYGEGTRAFIRLQEEIIRITNDHTIFCWSRNESVPPDWSMMLAPSPAAFMEAQDYIAIDAWEMPMPYTMTNLGLSIHLPVIYTLTQMFVVLDAGLSSQPPEMRASIAMQRTNQRRSGTNVLERNRSLRYPTMLSKEATDTRERFHLFIRSRYIPPPEYPLDGTGASMFRHGLILFVDPSATRLLSTSKRGAPLGSVGYDIETEPPGVFDASTALLHLPAFEGGSALFTSALLRISFTSPQEPDFYVFFAVTTTRGGREAWNCSVHFDTELDDIRYAMQDVELAPTSHMWAIHRYLRYGAWVGAERRQLLASSADESLFVSIGGALGHGVFGPGRTDIRAAVISGKFDTPHPLLPSARGAEAFDDSGDEEYLDDAEASDDEDWDSDEEEEIEEQQQKEEKEDDDDEVGGRRSRAIGTEPSWDSQKEMVLSQVEISGTKWI